MTTPQSTPAPQFEQEEWRPIADCDGFYEVSSLGRIRSTMPIKGNRGPRLLSLQLTKGYPCVKLRIPGTQTSRWHRVHRLVVEAFIGPIPEGYEVNHIDAQRTNNVPTNLELVTRTENMAHCRSLGRLAIGVRSGKARISEADVRAIRASRADGVPLDEIAQRFGISKQHVSGIAKGRFWKHLTDESGILATAD